ncbi:MAG: cupin domain-containing protein [Parcubacteria group bacterium]|jgi:nitric oxide dioxygenase
MNNWKNLQEMIEYPSDGILSKDILKNEKFDATLFIMAKGADLSEHTSTRAGIVHVIDGKGIFNLEDEAIKMRPGVFIHMGKNAIHSLRAEENTAFVLILFN